MTTSPPHINAQVDATPICPFTLKPISSINKSDLAVIYNCNPLLLQEDDKNAKCCGHECSLLRLTSYLHDTNVAGNMHSSCPVCQKSKVAVVCDGNAARALCPDGEGESSHEEEQTIIYFRYGAILYYLSLPKSSSSSRFSGTSNAISRIGAVLNVDVKHIIHKGKLIYPDTTNNDDVLEDMISISSTDISQKRKKPSLVVMGVRKQTYLKKTEGGSTGIVMAVVGLLSPRTLFSFVTWGFVWTLNATKSLGSGVWIFVQSMIYPPSQRSE